MSSTGHKSDTAKHGLMSDIKRLFRKKQKACNEAKASKKTKDWDHYQSIKKKCQIECRKTYNNHVGTMLNDDIKSNHKRL
jgi:hypothetical protein